MDGFDYKPIYKQVYLMGQHSVIAYNKLNESEPIGFESIWLQSVSVSTLITTTATMPNMKHWNLRGVDCPLPNEDICQKMYKVKITTDLRKYKAPGRGSKAWKNIFKRRTAVEHVNAYLKEYFQLNNFLYQTGKRAKVHFDLVTLIYNTSKLTKDRINVMLNQGQQVA